MNKMTRKEEIQKQIEDLQNELMEIVDTEEKSKLKELKSKYEEHHKLNISDEAIQAAVELSSKFITEKKSKELVEKLHMKLYS